MHHHFGRVPSHLGGKIYLEAYHLVNDGIIEANGGAGNCCGGSIHIVTHKLLMKKGQIEAVGGHSDKSKAGDGNIGIGIHGMEIAKREKLVFGFIREIQSSSFPDILVPVDILNLCTEFCLYQLPEEVMAAINPKPFVVVI